MKSATKEQTGCHAVIFGHARTSPSNQTAAQSILSARETADLMAKANSTAGEREALSAVVMTAEAIDALAGVQREAGGQRGEGGHPAARHESYHPLKITRVYHARRFLSVRSEIFYC